VLPLRQLRVVAAGLAAAAALSLAAAEPAITILAPVQPPYTTDEGGKPSGVFVDVLGAVSKDTGLEFKWNFLPWKRAQDLAKQGGDVLIMPLARSPEREPFYEWIVPVLAFDTVLFTVRKPPASLDDARELTIGLMFSTTFEKEVEAARITHIERVPDEITNARKLHAGRIDGWITTDMMAPGAYRQAGFNPDELRRGPKLGQTKVLYIAGSPGFPAELARRIADSVGRLKKDGRIDSMADRYR
jgi:polar amino acid transport system substrate-binding protein